MNPDDNGTPIDPRVTAIRNNDRVGRGSCTSIDEAMSDRELTEALDEADIVAPEDAVAWAIADEGMQIENALNYRWGSDDDPELKRYEDWNA